MFNVISKDGHIPIVRDFITFLKKCKYAGYPLTQSEKDSTLLGYVLVAPLLEHLEASLEEGEVTTESPVAFCDFLEAQEKPYGVEDISVFVNLSIMRCVPETPATQIHYIFRNLGLKIILVCKKARLVGMITKKSFIHHMEELHQGHEHRPTPLKALKTMALPDFKSSENL